MTKEDAVSFLRVKALPRSEVKSNDSQSHQLVLCATAMTGSHATCPYGTAAQHLASEPTRMQAGSRGSRPALAGHPLQGHRLRRDGISIAVGTAKPRSQQTPSGGSRAGHRAPLLVMVPTTRAGNPVHLLNSKTVNTLRTGRLDFFPLRGEDHALLFKLISSSSS